MSFKSIMLGLVVLGVGVAVGYFATPSKIEEREVIKEVEKIVEKKVYVKDTTKKTNKVTVKFVTIKPDGTRTIETKTYDTSLIEITQNGSINTEKDTTTDTTKEKTVEYSKNEFLVSIGVQSNIQQLQPSYGLHIEKRLIGPVYLGVFGYTNGSGGLNLGLGF